MHNAQTCENGCESNKFLPPVEQDARHDTGALRRGVGIGLHREDDPDAFVLLVGSRRANKDLRIKHQPPQPVQDLCLADAAGAGRAAAARA